MQLLLILLTYASSDWLCPDADIIVSKKNYIAWQRTKYIANYLRTVVCLSVRLFVCLAVRLFGCSFVWPLGVKCRRFAFVYCGGCYLLPVINQAVGSILVIAGHIVIMSRISFSLYPPLSLALSLSLSLSLLTMTHTRMSMHNDQLQCLFTIIHLGFCSRPTTLMHSLAQQECMPDM